MTQPVHQQWLIIAEQDLGVAKHLFDLSARYPNNLNFDEFRTKHAIEAAETILEWVKKNISEG